MPQRLAKAQERVQQGEVTISRGGVQLHGELLVPDPASGIVIFAHGSGSSRHSPRNKFVAQVLRERGMATLLLDLLTPEEDRDYAARFDIERLTARLVLAISWAEDHERVRSLPVGLFGASTGGASALRAAAVLDGLVTAVVSRGGRPDLAGSLLRSVDCPCLFIVGENDEPVIALNREALSAVAASEKQLAIVPGATHLFEEPGALEEVARLSADWFQRFLVIRAAVAGNE